MARFFIDRPVFAIVLAIIITLLGTIAGFSLPIAQYPQITKPRIAVDTTYVGASADTVEKSVAQAIEQKVMGVENMLDMTSTSTSSGQYKLNVQFNLDKNADIGSVEVQNRVSQANSSMPSEVSSYGITTSKESAETIMYFGLYSPNKTYDAMFLRTYADANFIDAVKRVKGVSKVDEYGPEYSMRIWLNPEKMAQLGVTVDDISTAIKSQNIQAPVGSIGNRPTADEQEKAYSASAQGRLSTPEEFGNVIIRSSNGDNLKLRDIAEIKRGYAEPAEPKMYFNGQPAVGIAISMEDGGNNIKLGANLDQAVRQIQQELPLGFELGQVANQPQVVKNAIGEFTDSLLEAILIVLAVSLLSLGRRCGYVISVCIPLVLLGTFIGMYAMNIDLHKVSLGALIISLGMLVDDAIVVVELMEVKMSEGWERTKAASYAFETCAMPLLTGTLITCTGFMPIFFAKSSAAEFASSLFPVISTALLLSWVISATVAPVLGHAWIKPKQLINENDVYNTAFYKKFRSVLSWSMLHQKIVILSTVSIFIGSLLLVPLIKQEFFPASVRPELLVELNLPEGSSIKATDEAALKLTNMLKDNPDVESIGSYVGKSAPRFVLVMDPVQPRNNYAQLVVVAKDIDARKRLEPQIRELVAANLPNVVSYSRSIPLGPPAAYPVMLRVTGPDDNIVKEYAQKVRTVMAQNPAVTMTRFDWMEQNGAAKLTIDNDKLRQMVLSRKEVATALQAEISGYTVAQYLEGDQAIDMVFRLQPVDRSTVTELETLTIPTSAGAVPLSQVARLSYESENGMIWRRNLLPTITVCGGIGEGVTGNDITQQVYDDLADLRQNLPNGVTIEIGGSLEDSAKTLGYLLEPVPVMLLLMMILLMLQLKDIRKLFIILCTAPLGVTGVMLGLIIFNAPLGFMAELGILALTGIIIRNSVVLIDQIDLHLQAGKSPWESVLESAIVRFRPIMLAALTTILGLIPMFTSPFWNSMAVAIACGLSAATLLTLIVLPVIYAAVFKIKPE